MAGPLRPAAETPPPRPPARTNSARAQVPPEDLQARTERPAGTEHPGTRALADFPAVADHRALADLPVAVPTERQAARPGAFPGARTAARDFPPVDSGPAAD